MNGGNLQWHLKFEHEGGGPDIPAFNYGMAGAKPVVGDWNGDGVDTIGYAEDIGANLRWHLRNSNSAGGDHFNFIFAKDTDNPVTGDWNSDGVTSVGITRDNGADLEWHLHNALPPGPPTPWALGKAGDTAMVGDLDHNVGLSCENSMPSMNLSPCGNNPLDSGSIPERWDLLGDDNKDGESNEPLPASALGYDCDGDGYAGSTENHLYVYNFRGDQDPCGTNTNPPTNPATPIGWPSDLSSSGGSDNRITLSDLTSFEFPPPSRLNTGPGDPGYHVRWDLMPNEFIALTDLTTIIFGPAATPPMLGGADAFNGPTCGSISPPWPNWPPP